MWLIIMVDGHGRLSIDGLGFLVIPGPRLGCLGDVEEVALVGRLWGQAEEYIGTTLIGPSCRETECIGILFIKVLCLLLGFHPFIDKRLLLAIDREFVTREVV
jgi:hypothetical protein